MNLLLPLLGTLSLLITQSLSSTLPTTEILSWPLSAPKPSLLARIAYDPTTLNTTVLSYTPPNPSSSSDKSTSNTNTLTRIGFYKSSPETGKQWIGSLVSTALLSSSAPTFRLHLDSDSTSGSDAAATQFYHVSLSSADKKSQPPQESVKANAEIVTVQDGAKPHLNKPVVVGPGAEEVVEEKSFLQRYWWVLLIVAFLTMGGGGGEGQ